MVRRALGRAMADIAGVFRGSTPTHLHLRDRLLAVAVATLALDLVASVAMYFLERGADRTEITSPFDALFFTSAQLLTVSSAMVNPLTAAGRLLDLALEVYAITVVGTLAGSLGAFFHRRSSERDAQAEQNA